MPIPTSNMMKEVKTPNAVGNKVLDLSQEAQQSVKLAASMAAPIMAAPNSIAAIATSVNNAKELKTANDAYTLYSQQMADLNAQLATKNADEAVAFQQEYEKTAIKYHNQFLGSLESVSNPQIRDEVRTRVNTFNTRNRESAAIKFDKETRQAQINSEKAAQDALVSNTLASFSPNADMNENKAVFEDLSAQLEGHIRAQLAAQGILDEKVIQQVTQDARENTLTTVRQYLDEQNTDTRAWKSNATAIEAIRNARDAGLISDQYAQKALKEEETQQLSIEVMRRPEQFLGKDLKFNPNGRPRFAPDLSQYEYERIARQAEQAAGSARDAMEAPVKQLFADKWRENDLAFRLGSGLLSTEDKKRIERLKTEGTDITSLMKEFDKRRQKVTRTMVRDYRVGLEQQRDRLVIIDRTGKLINEKPTFQDLTKAQADGNLHIIAPLRDNKELNDAIEMYKDIEIMMGEEQLYEPAKKPWWSLSDKEVSFTKGKTYTNREVIDREVQIFKNQYEQKSGKIFGDNLVSEIVTKANFLAGEGFNIEDGSTTPDGTPSMTHIQFDPYANNDDKDQRLQYMRRAAVKEAFRQVIPANVLAEMSQDIADYNAGRHRLQSNLEDMSGLRPGGLFTTTVQAGEMSFPVLAIPGFAMMRGDRRRKEMKSAWEKLFKKYSPQEKGITFRDEEVYRQIASDIAPEQGIL